MQADVGKYRADRGTLRRSLASFRQLAFHREDRVPKLPANKPQEGPVSNPLFESCHQPVMTHRVEKLLDVHFYDSTVAPPLIHDVKEAANGSVGGLARPKAVAVSVEQRLIECF